MDTNLALNVYCESLMYMLRDTEGIQVEIDGVLYCVWRDGPSMIIDNGIEGIPAGTMIWMHKGIIN